MFMKMFEGSGRVEPLFIDEHLCDRLKPKTQEDSILVAMDEGGQSHRSCH